MPRCTARTCTGTRCKLSGAPLCHVHENREDCVICISKVSNQYRLKCKHAFCDACILEWLIENDTCPCCRTEIDDTVLKKRAFEFGIDTKKLYKVYEVQYDLASIPTGSVSRQRVLYLTGLKFHSSQWSEVLRIPFVNIIMKFIRVSVCETYSRLDEGVYHRFVYEETRV
jgi:hypothetical protein